MITLVVHDIEPELARALEQAAAVHGHSIEDEHRAILRAALSKPSFKDVLAAMPDCGDDADFEGRI